MNGSEIELLSAIWLWLLPLLWLYISWWYFSGKEIINPSISDVDNSEHSHFYHPYAHQMLKQSKNTQTQEQNKFWLNISFWWQGVALSCLIVALAEPVLIGKRLPDPPPERDIVFFVDTSLSMQLKDYSLDGKSIKRMDLLRKLLDEFTTKMSGEHISVIVFAEKSYILVPLSNDQYLIRRMLSRVTTTLAGRYTAVGEALLLGLREANKQPDRYQIFILFTDADESRGKVTTVAAATLAAENNIPIYTIAIGSSKKNKMTKVQGGLYQAVNLSLLEEISNISKGKSYQVSNSRQIKSALNEILSQRENPAKIEPYYEKETLYFYPLMLGLMMLVLMQLSKLFGFLRYKNRASHVE